MAERRRLKSASNRYSDQYRNRCQVDAKLGERLNHNANKCFLDTLYHGASIVEVTRVLFVEFGTCIAYVGLLD